MNKFIIMGKTSISKNKFKDIEKTKSIWNKPFGGLWCSPFMENQKFVSDWHEWLHENMPYRYSKYCTIITFKHDARIYIIDSYKDLEELINNESFSNGHIYNNVLPSYILSRSINFVKLSEQYDVIYLTKKGERETRFSIPYTLYGWDCESCLILNYDSIATQYSYEIKEAK